MHHNKFLKYKKTIRKSGFFNGTHNILVVNVIAKLPQLFEVFIHGQSKSCSCNGDNSIH